MKVQRKHDKKDLAEWKNTSLDNAEQRKEKQNIIFYRLITSVFTYVYLVLLSMSVYCHLSTGTSTNFGLSESNNLSVSLRPTSENIKKIYYINEKEWILELTDLQMA